MATTDLEEKPKEPVILTGRRRGRRDSASYDMLPPEFLEDAAPAAPATPSPAPVSEAPAPASAPEPVSEPSVVSDPEAVSSDLDMMLDPGPADTERDTIAPEDEPEVPPLSRDLFMEDVEGGDDLAEIARRKTVNPFLGGRRAPSRPEDKFGDFDPVVLRENQIEADLMNRSRNAVQTVENRAKENTPLTALEIRQVREALSAASGQGVFDIRDGDSSEKRRFRVWNEIINGSVPNIERVDGQPGSGSYLFLPEQWAEVAQDARPDASRPRWEALKAAIEHQIGVIYAEWKLKDVTSNEAGKKVAAQNYDTRREQLSLAIVNNFRTLLDVHSVTGANRDGHYTQKTIYDTMSLKIRDPIPGVTKSQEFNMQSVRVRGIKKGMVMAQEQANIQGIGKLDDPFEADAIEQEKEEAALLAQGKGSPVPIPTVSTPKAKTAPTPKAKAALEGTTKMATEETTSPASPPAAPAAAPPAETPQTPQDAAPPAETPQAQGQEANAAPAQGQTPEQSPEQGQTTGQATEQEANAEQGQEQAQGQGQAPDQAAPAQSAQQAPRPVNIPSAASSPAVAATQYEQQGARDRAGRQEEADRQREQQEARRRAEEMAAMQQGGGGGGGGGGGSALGGILSGLGQGIGNVFRGVGQGVGTAIQNVPAGNNPASVRENILRDMSPSLVAARSNFAEGLSHINAIRDHMSTLNGQTEILSKRYALSRNAVEGVSSSLFPDDPTKMVREMDSAHGDPSKIRYPEGSMRDLMISAIQSGNDLERHRNTVAPLSLELQKSAALYANGVTAAADYLSKEGDLKRNGDNIQEGLNQGGKSMDEIGDLGKKLRENADTQPEQESVEKNFESAKKAMAEVVKKIINMIRSLFGRGPVGAGPGAPSPAPAP